ncbi:MAG TPA: HNH endonuclease [Dehalococcoidia bacterium]|nr:HNH endonuclease [Dehalococcoidia bacterium]
MTAQQLPGDFLERLRAVTSKRPRTVIEHIVTHGFITTEELETLYGYKHPPRAARDVREQGIPLETFRVKNTEGRTIAAYRFADPAKVRRGGLGGRKIFSKEFKKSLIDASEGRCYICLEPYEERYLQVDHRVPYEVSGDVMPDERRETDFMLLCGSCNRAKSWSCEHCPNWEEKLPALCESCYWARPEAYGHIALRAVRRLDLVWAEHEVAVYERLKDRAQYAHQPMPEYVKRVLKKHLGDEA